MRLAQALVVSLGLICILGAVSAGKAEDMSQKSKDWSEGDFIKCDDDSIYQWHNGKASPFKKPHTVPDWVPKGTPLTPEIPCPVHGPYPKDSVDTLPPGPPVQCPVDSDYNDGNYIKSKDDGSYWQWKEGKLCPVDKPYEGFAPTCRGEPKKMTELKCCPPGPPQPCPPPPTPPTYPPPPKSSPPPPTYSPPVYSPPKYSPPSPVTYSPPPPSPVTYSPPKHEYSPPPPEASPPTYSPPKYSPPSPVVYNSPPPPVASSPPPPKYSSPPPPVYSSPPPPVYSSPPPPKPSESPCPPGQSPSPPPPPPVPVPSPPPPSPYEIPCPPGQSPSPPPPPSPETPPCHKCQKSPTPTPTPSPTYSPTYMPESPPCPEGQSPPTYSPKYSPPYSPESPPSPYPPKKYTRCHIKKDHAPAPAPIHDHSWAPAPGHSKNHSTPFYPLVGAVYGDPQVFGFDATQFAFQGEDGCDADVYDILSDEYHQVNAYLKSHDGDSANSHVMKAIGVRYKCQRVAIYAPNDTCTAAVYVNDEPLMPGEHYIYSDGHHKKNFTVYYGKMVPGEAIVVEIETPWYHFYVSVPSTTGELTPAPAPAPTTVTATATVADPPTPAKKKITDFLHPWLLKPKAAPVADPPTSAVAVVADPPSDGTDCLWSDWLDLTVNMTHPAYKNSTEGVLGQTYWGVDVTGYVPETKGFCVKDIFSETEPKHKHEHSMKDGHSYDAESPSVWEDDSHTDEDPTASSAAAASGGAAAATTKGSAASTGGRKLLTVAVEKVLKVSKGKEKVAEMPNGQVFEAEKAKAAKVVVPSNGKFHDITNHKKAHHVAGGSEPVVKKSKNIFSFLFPDEDSMKQKRENYKWKASDSLYHP